MLDETLRPLVPQVLGALIRRYGQFDACEDAVQEALLAAAVKWPVDGMPDNPRNWLITVASRRLVDQIRAESARRRREENAFALELAPPADDERPADRDDTLTLLFMCCHPALSPASQLALTLRAVGGLTTAQIASAFLVPEATMAQRISRAKQSIKTTPFSDEERAERLAVVLHVLYLIFNEGYTATSGPDLHRADLTHEAIRLTREVHRLLPDDGEVAGLLALMLLTEARRPARTRDDGALVPLAEQDRSKWDADAIREGVDLITATLSRGPVGPYQVQAAIAAVHDEAPRAEDTDWPQVLMLYRLLERISAGSSSPGSSPPGSSPPGSSSPKPSSPKPSSQNPSAPNPMVTLNHAVAAAMVHGPRAGLDMLAPLDGDNRIAKHHRLAAVRAHLLEMAGDNAEARRHYQLAARRTTSLPEQRYLEARAARLAS